MAGRKSDSSARDGPSGGGSAPTESDYNCLVYAAQGQFHDSLSR